MKRTLAIGCLAAALTLGACADNDTREEEAAADATATDTVAVPVASETTVVREVESDDSGDRVTVDEDGVEADVGDGDTRVRADVDRDPSLTVESD